MKKAKITHIESQEILDSRGNPTVKTWVSAGGLIATAEVPSGASTGSHEALELRDGDKKRFNGKGVSKAVANVNGLIRKNLVGKDVSKQQELDSLMLELDGTENKTKLGANAILSVSMASTRLAAMVNGLELFEYIAHLHGVEVSVKNLPIPMCNIINGGVHADSGLDIQEFMILPKAAKFKERIRIASEVYHALKGVLKKQDYAISVGDEGGFAPRLGSNEQALEILVFAIRNAGYKPGKDVVLALDVAASEFYHKHPGQYRLEADKLNLTHVELGILYTKWLKKYPIVSIEDVFSEDDFSAWQAYTKEMGRQVMLVGDDLFVTNVKRLKMGIENKLGNAILIKLNQIGSVTETLNTVKLAQANKFKIIVSHRSGETCDTFIADLAVGVGAPYIKAGSLARGERIAKYNRLMEIESILSVK